MNHEGRWEVADNLASETELGEFLYGLVRMLKPALVVETGTYKGHTAFKLGRAVRDNIYGKAVSCDIADQVIERNNPPGLYPLFEFRLCSSLDLPELREADVVFSDSGDHEIRKAEYQLTKPGCVFVIHDCWGHTDKEPLGQWVKDQGGLVFPAGRGFGILIKQGR
jgi:hypothetical protein